ncbi:MAG: hypothetical protein QXV60_00250 [Nitrososphaerota archaeon]
MEEPKIKDNSIIFTFNNLFLNTDAKRLEYREISQEETRLIHWGQRKLLLSEIEFFTLFWNENQVPNPICVYAGAAPGIHIPILSSLFPSFVFHLYDKEEFKIQETDRIKIFKEYFTNEKAKEYSNRRDVFFISDIRRTGLKELKTEVEKEKAKELNEKMSWEDKLLQQNWVLLMNPIHALLKFRLPYPLDRKDKKERYLRGVVLWQPWNRLSGETRLVPMKNKDYEYEVGDWSTLEYEQWCFYHNIVERQQNFYKNIFTNTNEPIDGQELLNDFDSILEAYILKLYFTKIGLSANEIYQHVKNLSRVISSNLGKKLSELRQDKIKKSVLDPFRPKEPEPAINPAIVTSMAKESPKLKLVVQKPPEPPQRKVKLVVLPKQVPKIPK